MIVLDCPFSSPDDVYIMSSRSYMVDTKVDVGVPEDTIGQVMSLPNCVEATFCVMGNNIIRPGLP
jgi:hypothetical protein